MSASEASDDDDDEYAPGHMHVPDFEALAGDLQNRASRHVGVPPARRLRRRGGWDGGAKAMGPSPDEMCAGGSGTRRVAPGGCHHHMPVHDGARVNREDRDGMTAMGEWGGDCRGGGNGGDELVGTCPSRRYCTTTDSVR